MHCCRLIYKCKRNGSYCFGQKSQSSVLSEHTNSSRFNRSARFLTPNTPINDWQRKGSKVNWRLHSLCRVCKYPHEFEKPRGLLMFKNSPFPKWKWMICCVICRPPWPPSVQLSLLHTRETPLLNSQRPSAHRNRDWTGFRGISRHTSSHRNTPILANDNSTENKHTQSVNAGSRAPQKRLIFNFICISQTLGKQMKARVTMEQCLFPRESNKWTFCFLFSPSEERKR